MTRLSALAADCRKREGLWRALGFDCDSFSITRIARVIEYRLVLDAIVVPKGDHVGSPPNSELVSWVSFNAFEKSR